MKKSAAVGFSLITSFRSLANRSPVERETEAYPGVLRNVWYGESSRGTTATTTTREKKKWTRRKDNDDDNDGDEKEKRGATSQKERSDALKILPHVFLL